MTEFDQKLKAAIERGHRVGDAQQANRKKQKMSEDELRRRHNHFRLTVSERIEQGLKSLVQQMPGFQYETVYDERGWGAAASRDELSIREGERTNLYSRLEITIKPLSELQIVNLTGKGTVRNREIFSRNFHRPIDEADDDELVELVDRWILEYAQMYASAGR